MTGFDFAVIVLHRGSDEATTEREFYRFADAKRFCQNLNKRLADGNAHASIVDLRISQELMPNHYGRYEGYE